MRVRRAILGLSIALAGLTACKTNIQQKKSAAADTAFVAKAHKKYHIAVKPKPKSEGPGSKTGPGLKAKVKDVAKAVAKAEAKVEQEIDISTDLGFYKAILKELGVRETKEKIKFLMAWRQGEGGKAKNNPFNTSKHIPGTKDSKYNSHGVRNYPNRKIGLDATVATLRLGHYKEILALLKKDDVTAHQLAHTKALKKWGTGEMVKKVLRGRVNPPPIA